MIYIGCDNKRKLSVVDQYRAEHGTRHIVTISPKQFSLQRPDHDNVTYKQAIEYITFYRLLQEIDNDTLIVINECLRTQDRNDLTYNCIRHYLAQTQRQIIFQHLPQIDAREDFMILFDFDTQSRWKHTKFDLNLILDHSAVTVYGNSVEFRRIDVRTMLATQKRYKTERGRRFSNLGTRDPHTLPRNLYLVGGKDKQKHVNDHTGQLSLFANPLDSVYRYIARNKRLSEDNVSTYRDFDISDVPFAVLEFPHRFLNFADFMCRTQQHQFDVLVTDLKVDEWYFARYRDWGDKINETRSSLRER